MTGGGGSWTGGGGSWTGGGGGRGAGGGGGTGVGTLTVMGRVGNVTVGRVSCRPLWPEAAAAVQKPSTAIAAKNAPRQIDRSRRSVFTSQ
jgi:hypothetical protein